MIIKNLWYHLSNDRRKQFRLLLALMIIASITEIVSIGAVLPFLGALAAPEQFFQYPFIQPLIQTLELTAPSQLILPLTVIFIISVLIAGVVRLALLYLMTKLSYETGADLSIDIYQRTLYQDYSIHVSRNSSEIINSIITKTSGATAVIQSVLYLISSFFLLIGIMIVLVAINIEVALSAFIGFGLIYWLIIYHNKEKLKKNSQIIATRSTQIIKVLQEGLGGIRDVLIDGSQQFYCKLYRDADLSLRRASRDNVFISQSPRYVMEAVGMTLIALIAYVLTQQESGISTAIPTLGALALGAQRMLPVLQQAYGSYSTIKGLRSSFEDVLNLLNQSLPGYVNQTVHTPMLFNKEIEIRKLAFRYSKNERWVLRDVNLKFTKGMRIGFIGETGSGKSTLLDIVMGLLEPTKGELLIDQWPVNRKNRREWQMNIAHVPQNIYLSDNTIAENIAFGISKDKIDYQRVKKVAKQAQISEIIEQWSEGYQTFVGEQGVRLSGGQRQRIGIARALYKKSSVLIFDEATSSLDSVTESQVMKAIDGLGKEITILIIAHRVTTLKGCDRIVKLDRDNTIHFLDYKEIPVD